MKNLFASAKKIIKRPKRKDSIPEIIIDTICCWFITSGLVPLLYVQFTDFTLTTAFISAACVLFILALVTRVKWLFPVILGGGIISAVAYLLITDTFNRFIVFIRGFSIWLMAGMNNKNETYATKTNYTIVQVLICVGVACAIYLLVRIFHSTVPVIIGSAVIYFYFLLNGYTEYNVLSLMFLIAGAMPVIATNFYSRRKAGKTFFRKKKDVGILTPSWIVEITAVFLCAASIVGAFVIIPDDTSDMVNRPSANAVADIQSVTGLYTKKQRATVYPNLGNLNLQRHKNIGGQLFVAGDNSNFENKVIAYVSDVTAQEVYLKTAVFETFTGSRWTSEFEKSYRLGSGLFSSKEYDVFNKYKTENSKLNNLLDNITEEYKITVTLAEDNDKLSVPCGMTNFTELTPTRIPVLYNSLSEIYAYKALPKEYSYSVTYRDASINIEKVAAISEIAETLPDENITDPEFVKKYTALPDNYPLAVVNHAKKLTKESTSDYQSAVILTQYLCDTKHFNYVNNGSLRALQDGLDISYQLLRNKRGNSVYYASALTTMARALGIPSRLVAGYRISGKESLLSTTVWNSERKAFEISEDDAFCWTECYIKGIGWVSFYPSPVSTTYGKKKSNSQTEPQEFDGNDIKEQTEAKELPEEKEEKKNSSFKLDIYTLIYFGIFVLALAFLLLIRTLFTGTFTSLRSVRRRFKDTENQAEFYYWDIGHQLKTMQLGITNAFTTKDITEKLGNVPSAALVEKALSVIDKERFARHYTPTDADIEIMYTANKELEKDVKSAVSKVRYFRQRKYFRGDKITFVLSSVFISIGEKIGRINKKIASAKGKIKSAVKTYKAKKEG